MGFFTRRRHEPEFVLNLLYCAMRSMHDSLGDYTQVVRPSTAEAARVQVAVKLLPLAFSRGFLQTDPDVRMHEAFSTAYEGYFQSMPDRTREVAWNDYIVWDQERSDTLLIYREKFVSQAPQHFKLGPLVSMDMLMRVLSLIRNKRYLSDTTQAMEQNAMSGAVRQGAMIRVLSALGESFTRQVLEPIPVMTEPTGERIRASVGLSAALIGKGFFEATDMFKKL